MSRKKPAATPGSVRRRIRYARAGGLAAPPGTLQAPGDGIPPTMSVMSWGPDQLEELEDATLEDAERLSDAHPVTWVNVIGLGSADFIEEMGEKFELHRLALEDTLNTGQRPKLDDFDHHQYIVLRMPVHPERLRTEQVSLFLGDGFLITVQEQPGDCFDNIRQRVREGRPRIRNHGVDYLAYAVLDALIDSYFPLLDRLADRIDELELTVSEGATRGHLGELHEIKRDLVGLRRYLEPLRETFATLTREDSDILTAETKVYMADCYDHCKQAFDLTESLRANAGSVMDLYLAIESQRMNEVMKVLTVIATLFIPLSFIAGLYGMNFDPEVSRWNMPELSWTFGYPFALGVMVLCALAMLAYFWRKGWFR